MHRPSGGAALPRGRPGVQAGQEVRQEPDPPGDALIVDRPPGPWDRPPSRDRGVAHTGRSRTLQAMPWSWIVPHDHAIVRHLVIVGPPRRRQALLFSLRGARG